MSGFFATLPLGVTLACLAAAALGALGAWRHARAGRITLAVLQLPLALLLMLALASPPPRSAERLLVLTRDAPAAAASAPGRGETVVALPGAPASPGTEPVPDLATALRRHPDVSQLRVAGRGLAAHDRDALAARTLVFQPTSPPPDATGFVELAPPAPVRPGTLWTVRGRLRGEADRIELLDPAGAVVASVQPGTDGRFALSAAARAPGGSLFSLRARRAEHTAASMPLPVLAYRGAAPQVLLLGGLPAPESKFLRRWAVDAGVQLESRFGLAPTLVQRRGDARLDAATLGRLDLLIVDERSWPQLSAHSVALREAMAGGLGLLVRVTGPVPERTAREWRELGLDLHFEGDVPREVRLDAEDAPLHAWPVAWQGEAAPPPPAWRDAKGNALAAVRPYGLGRVGAVWLNDSFRLRTRGAPERHATLWAALVGAVARARAEAQPVLPRLITTGRRAVLCGLPAGARLSDGQGGGTDLVLQDGCAAWWPRERGWHRIATRAGDDVAQVYVHDPADVSMWVDESDRAATEALANGTGAAEQQARATMPRPAPWLAAWLGLMALAWWLERRARHPARPPVPA